MASSRFDIRAEFPNNEKYDFFVGAENLVTARDAAEIIIRQQSDSKIEWRGLVAFVGRKP